MRVTPHGNVFGGPTPAQQETWGALKPRYLGQRDATTAFEREPRRLVPHVFWRNNGELIKSIRKAWSSAVE